MSRLDGRVVVVTGAGRGLGREHAKLLASLGARVVVNDLGGDVSGGGTDLTPAQEVVAEITDAGGEAVVSGHDVADWDQAGEMIALAIQEFGTLHTVVNNAGILRDRTLARMTQAEWDAVVAVHLRGHAAPTHHAMAYWRERAKAGEAVEAPSLVHTSSASGFVGNFGQANYAAAKMGVVGLSLVARIEGASFGLRSNAIGPAASTRMGATIPGQDPDEGFLDPADVSPVVAWLADPTCPANGQLLHVYGNRVVVVGISPVVADLRTEGRWTLEALDAALPDELATPPDLRDFVDLP